MTAGSGTNTLITAPTKFYNKGLDQVQFNYCSDTNLLLAGTSSTTSLSSVITAWSDGYTATLTLDMDYLLTGG